jgi:predicted permease
VGLVPAYQAGKVDLAGALKSDSGGVVGGRARARLRSSLVMVQVSLSFVLLVGAGLLIQSLQRIRNSSPGFSTEGVLTSAVDLVGAGYNKERARIFEDELVDRLQAHPGVRSAAFVRTGPISYRSYSSTPIAVPGYQPGPDEQPVLEYAEVSPAYFATLGIPLVSGREFNRLDNEAAPPVAIVNETMAAQYWHGKDPVGGQFQMKDRWIQVVGVAKLSKYRSIRETPRPFFYVPLRQFFSISGVLYIRTQMSSSAMAALIAQEVRALDPGLAPLDTITMREKVNNMNYPQRLAVAMLGAFGGVALLLSAVGLYGVMSYAVSQSTRELGLRMALGAGGSDLLRLVMSQGLALTAGGILLGAVAAMAMTRLIGNLLFNVSPRDPLAFGLAFVVMTLVGVAACFLPAWRATRTDPVKALRG